LECGAMYSRYGVSSILHGFSCNKLNSLSFIFWGSYKRGIGLGVNEKWSRIERERTESRWPVPLTETGFYLSVEPRMITVIGLFFER